MSELVVLVDTHDRECGECEKLEAHKRGLLHRAFSIFLFDAKGRMLLQQRALAKYHSPGLWTNACCSHPRPGETIHHAAQRRLIEELGLTAPIKTAFSFIYRADVGQGLIEHEFDHVLIGTYEGALDHINPHEVNAYRWQDIESLKEETANHPDRFTVWFLIALPKVLAYQNSASQH